MYRRTFLTRSGEGLMAQEGRQEFIDATLHMRDRVSAGGNAKPTHEVCFGVDTSTGAVEPHALKRVVDVAVNPK
jgi:hypothetical protein